MLLAGLILVVAEPALAAESVQINDLVIARGIPAARGQPILFIATDLVKVENGRVTDNWHIEDNLTLLQQMGIAKIGP